VTYSVSAGKTITISDTIGGGVDTQITGGFVKSGDGTLVLSGANSYTGGTTVNRRTLVVANSGPTSSATGSGPVTVSSGTLAGTGRIAGAIKVSSGAFLQIGNGSSLGNPTLTTGLITFGKGVTGTEQTTRTDFKFTVNPNTPGVNTKLAAGGIAPLDPDFDGLRLRIRLDGAAVPLGVSRSGPWVLATFPNQTSLTTGTFTNASPFTYDLISDNPDIFFSSWSFTVTSTSITLNSFTPVPEPATVLGFGTLCIFMSCWWSGIPHGKRTVG
jgi:autotransporter-associated beta strand protein